MVLHEIEDMTTKNDQLTTIYIVRHGESDYNALPNKNIYKPGMWGEGGARLTKRGEIQAKKRAKHLKHIHFDAIFSSAATRAIQTAEIVKLERKLAIQTTEVIHERLNYILPGKTYTQTFEKIKKIVNDLDNEAKLAYKPDNQEAMRDESVNETATRLLTFLRKIAVSYKNKTVLVVNHGNNMKALLAHLGYAPYDELMHEGSVENTAYIVLESDGVDFFIKDVQGVQKHTD